jgi:hypothetical protein
MFEGAVSKVERANKHIRDLNDVLNAFSNTDLHDLLVETNPDTGKQVLRIVTPRMPEAVPFILGDAIHNLRTALDHVWWGATEWVGGTPHRQTKIPFDATRQKVIGRIDKGPIKALGGDEIIHVLMNVIEPHYDARPDNPFVALHNLDITDKHCALIPVLSATRVFGVSLEDTEGHWTAHNLSLRIAASGSGYVLGPETDGTFEIENKGRATFDVILGKDQPFGGRQVIPTLHYFSDAVRSAIQHFQDAAVRFRQRVSRV